MTPTNRYDGVLQNLKAKEPNGFISSKAAGMQLTLASFLQHEENFREAK